MKKKFYLKVLSAVLALAVLAACLPLTVSADTAKIRFGVISDIHYMAPSLKGDNAEWDEFVYNKHKEYNDIDSLLTNALDGVKRNAVNGGENYVLIPGDLTKDGELESHKALAARLEAFEKETGIQVLVAPGNHDINNTNGVTFKNGTKEPTDPTSPEQFAEIYKNLGYDLADSVFKPEEGKKGGMLSYTATLGGYKLIVVDTCMYSEDNGAEDNEHMTDGKLAEGLLDWVVEESKKAQKQGLTVVGMQHHNLIPHIEIEDATLWAFVVQEWVKVADAYADAGMHYVFTGHLHINDVNSYVSDNGETVYDILTPSLTSYPNYYKIVDFTSDGETITVDMQSKEIDEYQPVVSDDGTVYDKPFKTAYSFERTFGKGGIEEMLMGVIGPAITDIFGDIQQSGGLLGFLKEKDLDLEKIIVDALGTNGLEIGSLEILTVSGNIMGFINDLAAQIDNAYVNKPEETVEKIEVILHKLLSFKLTDKPATKLTDYLGYEVNPDGCTLGEFATTVLIFYFEGDEDISDYPYISDVLERFDSGVLAEEVFNLLREVLVTDLVQNEILANLDFNPGELFPEGNIFYVLGKVLQGITEALLGGDNSFINLIESVLSIPLVPEEYSSIDAIIDHLAGEYITWSQFESWGYTFNWMLSSFFFDENPDKFMDTNATFTYSGPVEVEVNHDNYRAPTNVVMSLGDDSSTSMNITWLTKYSVTGTDIEILPYSENPEFTGKPTKDSRVNAKTETVKRSYPGADLGIFALLPYENDYVQHTITLTGLEPGGKYCYRVGDAERDWWSEAGVIETANGNDDAFTFFFASDPQAQRPDHYDRFAQVIDTAYEEYPDAKFIVTAGDQVDYGENMKHWNYLLNSTENLLSLPMMPTTGNHEDEGAVITNNFALPNIPEQELDTGVYYSYDYNNVHYTVLNTNDIVDDKLSDAQLNWLKNDILSSDADWKILVLHKALYSNGSHFDDSDVEGMRSQLNALLPYLGVDLVLQGHDHVYLRTDVLNANAVVPTKTQTVEYDGLEYEMKLDPKGTIYSICGTSGVKVYKTKDVEATDNSFPRAQALVDTDYSMFSAITVDGNELYYNAYEVVDGKVNRVDSFAISKTVEQAPADKLGSDKLAAVVADFISTFKLDAFWKIFNALFDVYGKIMRLFW